MWKAGASTVRQHAHASTAVDVERSMASAANVLELGGFERLETCCEGSDLTNGKAANDSVLGAQGLKAWRHGASGIRVVRFSAPGPIVSMSIFVGTEPIGDGGHPHTLEHLIFLGSKRHPERGYLDTLACRCLGAGTNAYTTNEVSQSSCIHACA